MSKLLDKLERIARGTTAPLGFGASSRVEKLPPMVVIGLVDASRAKQAAEAAPALDAVLVEGGKDPAAIGKAVNGLGELPWGCAMAPLTADSMRAAREAGCDFVVVDAEHTPVGALDPETASLLAVSPTLDDRMLRTLETLPVDGVVVCLSELHTPLLVQDLMTIGVVRSMTGKTMFVEVPADLGPRELEALRDMEVAGLIVRVGEATAQQLQELRERLLSLPKPKEDRRSRLSAVLPHTPMSFGRRRREEEEEEEEEDE